MMPCGTGAGSPRNGRWLQIGIGNSSTTGLRIRAENSLSSKSQWKQMAGCPRSRRCCETWARSTSTTREPKWRRKMAIPITDAADVASPRSRKPARPGAPGTRHPAHDNHQNSNFLFRLRQLRNNCRNFIEYLVPALQLTAIFRALHGFISSVGEFRLAVSEILKDGHVVRTVYGLMFYSKCRRINLVSLRVRKVHGGNDLFLGNNLVVFNRIPELLPIRRLHAAERFRSEE